MQWSTLLLTKGINMKLKLPLPLIPLINDRGCFDDYGSFVSMQIVDAMHEQYPTAVVVQGVGSFGGNTAFSALSHRSVEQNGKKLGLGIIPIDYVCNVCQCTTVDICHKIPRNGGGNLTRDNLYYGCSKCNRITRDIIPAEQIHKLSRYTLTISITMKDFKIYAD